MKGQTVAWRFIAMAGISALIARDGGAVVVLEEGLGECPGPG